MPCKLTRLMLLCVVTATALSAKAVGPAAESNGRQSRPNILFIMTDQQPLGGVAAYGNPVIKTPALDTLAQTGCVFDQLYIVAFPCTPARASLLTGRYAHNHGTLKNDQLLDEKLPCLGDICRSSGYQTAYFGKWHLGGNMNRRDNAKTSDGLGDDWRMERVPSDVGYEFKRVPGGLGEDHPQHGFDTWVGGWKHYRDSLAEAGFGELLKQIPFLGNHNDAPSGMEGTHNYSLVPEEHHVDAFLAKRAEQFVRGRADNPQPWCAVLSFYGPHLPVAPPKPWNTMYSLDQVTLPSNHRDTLECKPAGQKNDDICYMLPKWNDDQFKDYIRRYWGYCSFIDQQIGLVLKTLRDTRQWDNTIVVFTSDHGDMVGAHGMIYKLVSCGYEELYHVPAIIRIPGVTKPGSRNGALVSSIDLLPTLLDAAKLPCPEEIDGMNLVGLLKGQTTQNRDMVFAACDDRTIICCDGRYKFVLNPGGNDLSELYDLKADPGEMKNLAYVPQHKALADKMSQQVITWLRETKHPYAEVIAAKAAGNASATKPFKLSRADNR